MVLKPQNFSGLQNVGRPRPLLFSRKHTFWGQITRFFVCKNKNKKERKPPFFFFFFFACTRIDVSQKLHISVILVLILIQLFFYYESPSRV